MNPSDQKKLDKLAAQVAANNIFRAVGMPHGLSFLRFYVRFLNNPSATIEWNCDAAANKKCRLNALSLQSRNTASVSALPIMAARTLSDNCAVNCARGRSVAQCVHERCNAACKALG